MILQILSALGGVGKVSYYMLPLSGPSFPQPPSSTSFFLSCLEFALLNSVYKEIILKRKQVLCLESVYVRLANGLREVLNFSPSANVVIIFAKYKLRSDVLLGWRSNASSTTVVNSIVIVVSPLNSLMNDQISRNLSVSYRCERFDENMDDDFNVDVDFRLCQVRKLRNGNYHIVFAHPESLISSKYGGELLLTAERGIPG